MVYLDSDQQISAAQQSITAPDDERIIYRQTLQDTTPVGSERDYYRRQRPSELRLPTPRNSSLLGIRCMSRMSPPWHQVRFGRSLFEAEGNLHRILVIDDECTFRPVARRNGTEKQTIGSPLGHQARSLLGRRRIKIHLKSPEKVECTLL